MNIIQNCPAQNIDTLHSFENMLSQSSQSQTSVSNNDINNSHLQAKGSLDHIPQNLLTGQKRAGFKNLEQQPQNKKQITLLEVQSLLPKKIQKIEEKKQEQLNKFSSESTKSISHDSFQIKQEYGSSFTDINSNTQFAQSQPQLNLPPFQSKVNEQQKQKLAKFLENPLIKQILNYDLMLNNNYQMNNFAMFNQQQDTESIKQQFYESFLQKSNDLVQFQLDNVLVIHKEKKNSQASFSNISEEQKKSRLSKFHSKKKEFLNDVLSFYTIENLEKINMPIPLRNEILRVTKSLKEICQIACGKKVIEFNRVHYFLLFLCLNDQNIEVLQNDLTNKNLHSLIFNFDMTYQNKNDKLWQDKCQYVNFIKDCIYQIAVRHIKPLMDFQFQQKMISVLQQQQEQSEQKIDINQEIMQMQYNKKDNYEERAFEGVKTLNQGTIVLRF